MKNFTYDDRKKIIDRLIAEETLICDTKGREYSQGAELGNEEDVLNNFKQVGSLVHHKCSSCGHKEPIGAENTLAIYYMKHVLSLINHCSDPSRENDMSESIHSRVLDARVYPALLECLSESRKYLRDVSEVATPVNVVPIKKDEE